MYKRVHVTERASQIRGKTFASIAGSSLLFFKVRVMGLYTLLVTLLCTVVLPVLLLLAAVKLWQVLVIRGLDPSCTSPLPPGTMGLPFIGETLQLILQVTRGSARPCFSCVSVSDAHHVFHYSTEKKVSAHEASKVRLHLQNAPLREPHGARHGR